MGDVPRFYDSDIKASALADASITSTKFAAGAVNAAALAAGAVANVAIAANAAIANTKLAAPKSYFCISAHLPALAAQGDAIAEFQMPFAATLTEVSAVAQTASGTTATVDVLEAGATVLAAPIDVKTAAGTPQVAAPADAAIADNAVVGIQVAQTGAGATSGVFVVLTFKVAHVA